MRKIIIASALLSLVACKKGNFDTLVENKINNEKYKDLIFEKDLQCTGANLIWSDEFNDGIKNLNFWQNCKGRVGYGVGWVGTKWHNNNIMNDVGSGSLLCQTGYPSENVLEQNGKLKIITTHDRFINSAPPGNNPPVIDKWCNFVTGHLETRDFDCHYGYYEISAKIPKGKCIGSAFWLYDDDLVAIQEIDIFENRGESSNIHRMNVHRPDLAGVAPYNQAPMNDIISGYEDHKDVGFDMGLGFHTYGLLWKPDRLEWYVDNKLVRSVTSDQFPIPDQPMRLVISVNMPHHTNEIPSTEVVDEKNDNLPQENFEIDYVRVYDEMPVNANFSLTDGAGNLTTQSIFTDWSCNWDQIGKGKFNSDSYSDLFYYSKVNNLLYIATTNGSGQIVSYSTIPNFGSNWDQIVCGNFGGSSYSDLFMYDKTNNIAKFYSIDGTFTSTVSGTVVSDMSNWDIAVADNLYSANNSITDDILIYKKSLGKLSLYNTLSGFALVSNTTTDTDWTKIVSGNFDGLYTDELLCYNSKGKAKFYSLSQSSSTYALKRTYTDWRGTWNNIVPGFFNGIGGGEDLLMYDQNGEAYFFQVNYGDYGLTTIKNHSYMNKSWDIIVSGHFGGNSSSDLMFYDH